MKSFHIGGIKMKRNLALNLAVVLASVVLLIVVLLSVPDMALDLLLVVTFSTAISLLALWRSGVDAKKDERTIQLMGYGARNAFIFLLFAMPWLAVYHMFGIISLDAAAALWILWIMSFGIAWLTFLYYYTR
jgi:hypothetical protein